MSRIWKETFAAIFVCHLVKGFANNMTNFEIFICCSARPYKIINKNKPTCAIWFLKISKFKFNRTDRIDWFLLFKNPRFSYSFTSHRQPTSLCMYAVLFQPFYVTIFVSIQDDYGIISFISAVKIASIGLNLGIRNWRLALHFFNYRTFVQSFKSASGSSVLPQSGLGSGLCLHRRSWNVAFYLSLFIFISFPF